MQDELCLLSLFLLGSEDCFKISGFYGIVRSEAQVQSMFAKGELKSPGLGLTSLQMRCCKGVWGLSVQAVSLSTK